MMPPLDIMGYLTIAKRPAIILEKGGKENE